MGHNLKGRGDLVLDIRKWSEIVLKFYSFRISFKKYRASTQIRVCVPSAIITGKKNSIILLGNHKFLFKFWITWYDNIDGQHLYNKCLVYFLVFLYVSSGFCNGERTGVLMKCVVIWGNWQFSGYFRWIGLFFYNSYNPNVNVSFFLLCGHLSHHFVNSGCLGLDRKLTCHSGQCKQSQPISTSCRCNWVDYVVNRFSNRSYSWSTKIEI